MTAGTVVDKFVLDNKLGSSIVALRQSFEQCARVNQWLNNNPPVDNIDPLTVDPFNYTADEAYAIRLVFQNFAADFSSQASNFSIGSKFTGLD